MTKWLYTTETKYPKEVIIHAPSRVEGQVWIKYTGRNNPRFVWLVDLYDTKEEAYKVYIAHLRRLLKEAEEVIQGCV